MDWGGGFLSERRVGLLVARCLGSCWFQAVLYGPCMRGGMMLERRFPLCCHKCGSCGVVSGVLLLMTCCVKCSLKRSSISSIVLG